MEFRTELNKSPLSDSLDELDRHLVMSIVRDPGGSYTQWAAESGTSARTAARRFENLSRRGLVKVIGRTPPDFDGALAWLVRIFGPPDHLQSIAAKMSTLKPTRWVRMSRDVGELFCGMVSVPSETDGVIRQLRSKIPHRDLHVHQMMTVWGIPSGFSAEGFQLDMIDRALLDVYAQDGRASAARIASNLSIDPATVTRRRQRLISAGVLFFEADVHPDIFSRSANLNLWIKAAPGSINELGDYLSNQDHARYVAAVSGTQQLFANVTLPTVADVVPFLDTLDGWGIRGLEVVPMGATWKRSSP